MSLTEKDDKRDCLSANPDARRHSDKPMRQRPGTDSPRSRLDELWVAKVGFVEDFTLEHSAHGSHVASIEIASFF